MTAARHDDPLSGATPLDRLIDYQEAAVVSRVLTKNAGGSVTLFAFAAGEELSEHTAPFDALLYVLDGALKVRVAGQEHQVDTGSIIRLPAHVPHGVTARQTAKMLLVMVRADQSGG